MNQTKQKKKNWGWEKIKKNKKKCGKIKTKTKKEGKIKIGNDFLCAKQSVKSKKKMNIFIYWSQSEKSKKLK